MIKNLGCSLCKKTSKYYTDEDCVDQKDENGEFVYYREDIIILRELTNESSIGLCEQCNFTLQNISIKTTNEYIDETYSHRFSRFEAEFTKRLNDLHQVLLGYKQGLDNVYALFQKATDENFLNNFNKKLAEFKEDIRKIEKEVNHNSSFVKQSMKTIGAVKDLHDLTKFKPQFINKLASITRLMNEEDYD